MAKQIVTLRLDEDDLTYLAELDVPGATNLSEKMRVLLAEARAQRAGHGDYGAAYDFTRRLFAGPDRCVRDAEVQAGVRSEFIGRVLTWLPDTAAYLLSAACATASAVEAPATDQVQRLRQLEKGLGERVIALVDSVLQQAHAGFPGCYDSDLLANRTRSALGIVAAHRSDHARGETRRES
jgi:hypothetical protein